MLCSCIIFTLLPVQLFFCLTKGKSHKKKRQKQQKENVILEIYPSTQLHTHYILIHTHPHPTIHFIHKDFTSNSLTQKCQNQQKLKEKTVFVVYHNGQTISFTTYRLIFHECCNPFFRLRPGDDPISKVDLSMIHWADPLFLPIKK